MVPMEHIITDNRFSLSNIQQKAKKFLSFCAVFGLLIFLLIHPSESLECAKAGMTLWLNTLIPTLLPFIILTGTLTHINSIQKLLAPLESFFRIVLGMLCGYPLGAKLASDLYTSRKISKKEALYLTTFCNNASPAFIITYLNKLCLKNTIPVSLIFISIFSANLICMLFFRFAVYKNSIYSFTVSAPLKKETSHTASQESILDVSIMNGFETITRLGGYILLFSILAGCIRYYHPFPVFYQYLLLGFTEITTGLSIIASSELPAITRILISVSATSSGGLCILAQTRSILHRDLSLLPYIISKCVSAVLTSIILYYLI